jgi:hypothetical protein
MKLAVWTAIIVALAITVALVVRAAQQAQPAPQAIADGFAAIIAGHQTELDELRAKNVDLDRQIIEDWREGYGRPAKADLPEYMADLAWAKTRLEANDPAQRDLDRDIAWCRKRLK